MFNTLQEILDVEKLLMVLMSPTKGQISHGGFMHGGFRPHSWLLIPIKYLLSPMFEFHLLILVKDSRPILSYKTSNGANIPTQRWMLHLGSHAYWFHVFGLGCTKSTFKSYGICSSLNNGFLFLLILNTMIKMLVLWDLKKGEVSFGFLYNFIFSV